MKKIMILLVLGSIALISGCTWVKESRGAQQVDLVKPRYVQSCKYLGTVETKVLAGLGGVKRSKKKVARELATLARNEAAAMGGDTIVINSRVRKGRRSYKVYRCR